MHLSTPLTALILLLLTPLTTTASTRPKNAILLSQIRSLTLRSGSKTTHRRVSAIPQLKCVSPAPICALHRIDVMRCTNQGSSYSDEDVQWSCKAELPEELRLGSTEVICEGYDSPDDPYVLKGSCGVEYRLVLTEKGENRYPDIAEQWSSGRGWDTGSYVFVGVFLAVLAWILYSAFFSARDVQRRVNDARRGGGGFWPGGGDGPGGWGGPGWGPGGDNDPPPPYPGHKPYGSGGSGQQWQPGFWTGLAGGAAATYLASRANNNNEHRDQRRYGGRGWSRGESSSSAFTSGSSARHESTGFGSTSRR
ncbi:hypothetical protein jhhlp_001905 [Lomentospora prolificans]|uniref:Store-operated calcium entry-associated regulatory factor n=1 Tax=Lomentospora prolificans TaxID=41688 RepID=A0A2N3NCH9_9PEZI|nr:hypothetical protein jhhlp_001905 [Lomentospora prolificans]